MAFGDWLSGLGSGISNFFGGGGGGGVADYGFSPEATQGAYQGFAPGGQFGDVASAASGAGSGGGGWLDSFGGGLNTLGGIAKAAAPIAQLGATGMGIFGGINQMRQGAQQMDVLKQQQRQQQQMAAPAAQAGGALTSAGQSALLGGALPPALEAQVEDFKNKARMQMQQRLASQGMTDSSAGLQYDAWIENQAQQLRGQLASNLYNQGLAGIGTALGPSSTVSQTALGMAGGSQQSIAQAQEALNKLLGSQ